MSCVNVLNIQSICWTDYGTPKFYRFTVHRRRRRRSSPRALDCFKCKCMTCDLKHWYAMATKVCTVHVSVRNIATAICWWCVRYFLISAKHQNRRRFIHLFAVCMLNTRHTKPYVWWCIVVVVVVVVACWCYSSRNVCTMCVFFLGLLIELRHRIVHSNESSHTTNTLWCIALNFLQKDLLANRTQFNWMIFSCFSPSHKIHFIIFQLFSWSR